jgi:hypothetical protein
MPNIACYQMSNVYDSVKPSEYMNCRVCNRPAGDLRHTMFLRVTSIALRCLFGLFRDADTKVDCEENLQIA